MTHDYELTGQFPWTDLKNEAIRRLVPALGPEAWTGENHGALKAGVPGLYIYATEPEDDYERGWVAGYLGMVPNLSVVFSHHLQSTHLWESCERAMIRSASSLAADRDVRAMLFLDYCDDDAIVLKIDRGRICLNHLWEGWVYDRELHRQIAHPYSWGPLSFLRPDEES